MDEFYSHTLEKLLQAGLVNLQMRILIVCGGTLDQKILGQAGFKDVTISNLDARMDANVYAPFAWSYQDAENITFKDNEFDFCIAHNGLHHCHSPHRALLEMYRVGRKGLLVFEPRDGLIARLGVKMNLGQEYEVAAVFGNACAYGGVRNTTVPNYVYRWTEREVKKSICSYAPWGKHRFLFFYALRLHWDRLRDLQNKAWLILTAVAFPLLRVLTWVLPKQSNNFAFAVFKPNIPADLQPWIEVENGNYKINKTWLKERYGEGRSN
jgi:SAM-dependent methyltransferase